MEQKPYTTRKVLFSTVKYLEIDMTLRTNLSRLKICWITLPAALENRELKKKKK